ncbi:hypothetical protein [Streptomyces sp. NBC_00986]|uniref:hypothetical protein n=1 Tax=Streptomyces sp. NBC_00986 TaxID=2903702 RepID=UPI003863A324|nr:hypothetical protein OG504_47035 [Streptomyces sp. NBC_00986]
MAGTLLGLPLVAGCGSSSGSADGHASPVAARSGGTTDSATTGSAASGGASGTSWVLTAPQVAAGYRQGQPPSDMVQRFDADTKQNAARLGVSGTHVRAYYDDPADGAWIFYVGLTGSGYDPDHLHDILDQLPAVSDDGAGDRITTSAIDATPGPHGGRAICDTVLLRNGLITTAVTTCSWFTPTTVAGITLVSKTDGTSTKLGFTATDVAPIMRAVRARVEVRRQ